MGVVAKVDMRDMPACEIFYHQNKERMCQEIWDFLTEQGMTDIGDRPEVSNPAMLKRIDRVKHHLTQPRETHRAERVANRKARVATKGGGEERLERRRQRKQTQLKG